MTDDAEQQPAKQNPSANTGEKPAASGAKKPVVLSDFHLNRVAGVFELLAKWEKSGAKSAPPPASN